MASLSAGQHDGADGGQEQEDRGGLEREQEAFEEELADRFWIAEAGTDLGAVGAEGHQRGSEHCDGELYE